MQPKIVRPASAQQTYCPDPPHFPQSPSRDKTCDLINHCQPKPGTFATAGSIRLVKAAENFLLFITGNPDSVICNRQDKRRIFLPEPHPDMSVFPAIAVRIAHKIHQQPRKSSGLTEIMTVFVSYSNVIPRSRISFISEQTASTSSAASTKASGYFPERISSRAKSSI